MNRISVLYALASAMVFGASTPAANFLLDPFVLAGLLYCGAGVGVAGLVVGVLKDSARSR